MDFFQQAGTLALGSRLRRLSGLLTEDAAKTFALYEVDLEPHWFPIFFMVSRQDALSISTLAQQIGQPHPAVSQIVKAMRGAGLVETSKDASDGRVHRVSLTDQGRQLIPRFEEQCLQDVQQAVDLLLSEMQYDLWKAIEEVEHLLEQKDLHTRVREQRKQRERQAVEILDYGPEFREDFKRLNYEWIEQFFTIEDFDRYYLEDPESTILNQGGAILMARYQGEIVGTCALVKRDETCYELAKMGVTAKAQGKHIGFLLGQKIIAKARELGATKVVIDSNTRLEAAINLYYKLGFQKVIGTPSHYSRCNIQFELLID